MTGVAPVDETGHSPIGDGPMVIDPTTQPIPGGEQRICVMDGTPFVPSGMGHLATTCGKAICKAQLKRLKRRMDRYGITVRRYMELFAGQDEACAICLVPPIDQWELDIDHDHRTGEVRGLLCNDCNVAIGRLNDSADNAARAASYLSRREARRD